jgi:hypothetical protein
VRQPSHAKPALPHPGEGDLSMIDASVPSIAGSSLLFLREEEIRAAQDLLFFAYRDFTNVADVILEELELGRAHHRALHFIGRNPGIPVTELLAILRITKQSLARVRLMAAYRDAGVPSVEGFRRVMRGIMDEAARTYMDRAGQVRARAARPVRTGETDVG